MNTRSLRFRSLALAMLSVLPIACETPTSPIDSTDEETGGDDQAQVPELSTDYGSPAYRRAREPLSKPWQIVGSHETVRNGVRYRLGLRVHSLSVPAAMDAMSAASMHLQVLAIPSDRESQTWSEAFGRGISASANCEGYCTSLQRTGEGLLVGNELDQISFVYANHQISFVGGTSLAEYVGLFGRTIALEVEETFPLRDEARVSFRSDEDGKRGVIAPELRGLWSVLAGPIEKLNPTIDFRPEFPRISARTFARGYFPNDATSIQPRVEIGCVANRALFSSRYKNISCAIDAAAFLVEENSARKVREANIDGAEAQRLFDALAPVDERTHGFAWSQGEIACERDASHGARCFVRVEERTTTVQP